jgi:hypothetical protein
MSVHLSGRMPTGDKDGLQTAESDLRELREPIVVVAVLYPRTVADVLDRPNDPSAVTCGVSAIEALSGDEAMAAHALMGGAYERRTGKAPLPFGAVAWPEDEG